MIREYISCTSDPRDMFLSLQMVFSFVRAAEVCEILEKTSSLELLSKTITLWFNPKFLFFHFDLNLNAISPACNQFQPFPMFYKS